MKISENTAAEIAIRLSETINQNINVMNTEGIIIASSDPSRIGQLHAGAKKLMEEGLDYLVVEDDMSYEGTRNGVNLPIVSDGELVGTIGITGPVSEVFQYGQIIKRMTEILLLDRKLKEQRTIEQKARDRFLDEWILGELEKRDETEFRRLAAYFSIDPEAPARISAMMFLRDDQLSDEELTDISRYVRNTFGKEFGGYAFRTATHMIGFANGKYSDRLSDVISSMFAYISNTYRCRCFAGIDEKAAVFSFHDNYKEATMALRVAVSRGRSIVDYDPLDLEFVIENISGGIRENYMVRLFGELSGEEKEKQLDFAKAYLEADGSLSLISEKLFVHVNTVKYRIRKLEELTGVDIRTCYGAYVFTLACKLAGKM